MRVYGSDYLRTHVFDASDGKRTERIAAPDEVIDDIKGENELIEGCSKLCCSVLNQKIPDIVCKHFLSVSSFLSVGA